MYVYMYTQAQATYAPKWRGGVLPRAKALNVRYIVYMRCMAVDKGVLGGAEAHPNISVT